MDTLLLSLSLSTKKGGDPTLILSDQLYDVPLSDSISILLFFPPLPYFLSIHLSSFLFSLHFSLLSHFSSFYFVCCLNKLIVCYTMFPYTQLILLHSAPLSYISSLLPFLLLQSLLVSLPNTPFSLIGADYARIWQRG